MTRAAQTRGQELLLFVSKSQQLNSTGGDGGVICWEAPLQLLLCQRVPSSRAGHGIAVAQESFQKAVSVGKSSQSCYTDGWENAASELSRQNLFTQSLPLFPCSFRLGKPSKSSAGSPETTLKSDFARQEPAPLSLIRKYPAPRREKGTVVAPSAWPCPAGCLGCQRKPTAALTSLSVTSYGQCSLLE